MVWKAICFVIAFALYFAPGVVSCEENTNLVFSLDEAMAIAPTLNEVGYVQGTGNVTRTENQLHIQDGTFSIIAVTMILYKEDIAINLSTGLVEEWKA